MAAEEKARGHCAVIARQIFFIKWIAFLSSYTNLFMMNDSPPFMGSFARRDQPVEANLSVSVQCCFRKKPVKLRGGDYHVSSLLAQKEQTLQTVVRILHIRFQLVWEA